MDFFQNCINFNWVFFKTDKTSFYILLKLISDCVLKQRGSIILN